ncbi:zf-HC2 domain-containing protein [Nocardioides sp. URHA0020]|uniref:zf-HC2 domain-containing protein n=1 Tax=Nocardioides sp. URHA0020 TaxID=1380392 RepID=UPI00048CD53F|nr:zf-HC2 domain-containing protein [Nocardioides sp. URHA0020]
MIGPVGHLGTKVSALLDGRLSADDTERAWAHVHTCHACRDLVEREGWVKTSLAGLSFGPTSASDSLKGSLLGALPATPDDDFLTSDRDHRRRQVGLVALGGGAVGAAVVGVLALGFAPADAPTNDRRAPASINQSQAPRVPATSDPHLLRSSVSATPRK